MNIFPDKNLLIETENLLSSSTYPSNKKQLCVYCHMPVEREMMSYDLMTLFIRRCDCELAKKEIKIKSNIINELTQLDELKNQMDLKVIGTAIYKDEVLKLQKRYRPEL